MNIKTAVSLLKGGRLPDRDEMLRQLSAAGFERNSMQRPLDALGYEILQTLPVLGIFDKGKVASRPEIIGTAERYGEILARDIMHRP